MAEYFDIVDEKDNVIGKATRQECHADTSLIHRVVMILIFNSKGELLLQKRSKNMDMYPKKWTISVGGHVGSGEDYDTSAQRELKEEIGIKTDLKKLFSFLFKGEQETEICTVYKGTHGGPFKIDKQEVDEVKFFKTSELRGLLKEQPDMLTPAGKQVLEEYFQRSGDDRI
jgi:isopentenyl-diphosphate delta-isomerase type 1